jgi:pyruvate-ferredoxin/flavodoxin oxidoreductase
MQRAVACGYFPLFRYRPDAKSEKLMIDSPAPTLDFADFLQGETRYARLMESDPARARELWHQAKEETDARYARLQALKRVYG